MNGLFDRPPSYPVSTSQAAAAGVAPVYPTRQAEALAWLADQTDGATCDDLEAAKGWLHQSASSVLWALEKKNLVRKGPDTRPTRRGTRALVYRVEAR